MSVFLAPETPEAKERLKWEYSDYQIGTSRGQRGPRVFEDDDVEFLLLAA